MNQDNLWVRLYPRKNDLIPTIVGGESLKNIVDVLTDIRADSPIIGFACEFHLDVSLTEMEDLISCISENERSGVQALVTGIEKLIPGVIASEQRANYMMNFRIDLLSAEGNLAAGGVVLVEQQYSYVPTGMIRRSLLPTLKRLTGLDLSKPGNFTLKTVRNKIAWLAGDDCPELFDENNIEVSRELKRVTGPIHFRGPASTRVDWF